MESLIKSNHKKILYRVVIVNFTACRCYFKTYRVNMFGVQPKFHVCIVKNLNVDVDIAYIYLTKFFLEHKYAMKGFYKEFILQWLSVAILWSRWYLKNRHLNCPKIRKLDFFLSWSYLLGFYWILTKIWYISLCKSTLLIETEIRQM